MRYDSEKHTSNMGELFGSGSYIIRRKEDNQVISGYLRDVARMDTQSRNPFGNHYEISKSQFDAVNESNILGHLLRDKRIASFIQDGVSIDNFADLERMPDYPINTSQFHELHSLRDGEFEVSNEARVPSKTMREATTSNTWHTERLVTLLMSMT